MTNTIYFLGYEITNSHCSFYLTKTCEGARYGDRLTSPAEEILSAKTKTCVSNVEDTQMRRQLKFLLISFSGEERKTLANKLRHIGGILHESSVRILYFIIQYDISNPD